MVETAVGADHEDVQPVQRPGGDRRSGDEPPSEEVPIAPARPRPGAVVERGVGAADEDIDSIGSPGDRRGRRGEAAAQ